MTDECVLLANFRQLIHRLVVHTNDVIFTQTQQRIDEFLSVVYVLRQVVPILLTGLNV